MSQSTLSRTSSRHWSSMRRHTKPQNSRTATLNRQPARPSNGAHGTQLTAQRHCMRVTPNTCTRRDGRDQMSRRARNLVCRAWCADYRYGTEAQPGWDGGLLRIGETEAARAQASIPAGAHKRPVRVARNRELRMASLCSRRHKCGSTRQGTEHKRARGRVWWSHAVARSEGRKAAFLPARSSRRGGAHARAD